MSFKHMANVNIFILFTFIVLLAKGNLESTGKVVSSKRKSQKKEKGGKSHTKMSHQK